MPRGQSPKTQSQSLNLRKDPVVFHGALVKEALLASRCAPLSPLKASELRSGPNENQPAGEGVFIHLPKNAPKANSLGYFHGAPVLNGRRRNGHTLPPKRFHSFSCVLICLSKLPHPPTPDLAVCLPSCSWLWAQHEGHEGSGSRISNGRRQCQSSQFSLDSVPGCPVVGLFVMVAAHSTQTVPQVLVELERCDAEPAHEIHWIFHIQKFGSQVSSHRQLEISQWVMSHGC